MINNNPLLSVCLITYNQINYISQAIEGVLMQKVDFEWELIIADDFSTDGTRDVILQYQKKHPNLIKLILQEINVGAAKNWQDLITTPKSKYIAYFEGDDFWTDSNKLQKQINFIKANPDYSICFHNALVYNQEKQLDLFIQPGVTENRTFELKDFLHNNPIPTVSLLFEREYIKSIPDWFKYAPFGDYALYLLILSKNHKKAMCLVDNMAVYRIHGQSSHGKGHLSDISKIEAYQKHIKFWDFIEKYLLKGQYQNEINKTKGNTYRIIINILLDNKQNLRAFLFNTKWLFKLKFSSIKENILVYFKIMKSIFKG